MKRKSPVASLQVAVLLLTLGQASASSISVTAGGSSPQGFNDFQTQDFLTQNGANLFSFAQDWNNIETAPGQYNLSSIVNPLTYLVPNYSFKSVVLDLRMIDSNTLTTPADLQNTSFNNPIVQQRFLAMLQAIAQQPSSKEITSILLGNEVDLYLTAHPTEIPGFVALLKASIAQIHREMPWVKVGTVTTFGSLNNPQLFQELTQYSDFIDYSYYPIDGWDMEPVSQVPGDLERMAAAAGSKPFAFTEIGYSSSTAVDSSQADQADFVKTVFDTLDQYRNRLSFIDWNSLADPPPGTCQTYATEQAASASTQFCDFFDSLGLRTYDNEPKQAWNTFLQEIDGVSSSAVRGPWALPEPSTWTLMFLGFAVLGFAGCRKVKRNAPVAV